MVYYEIEKCILEIRNHQWPLFHEGFKIKRSRSPIGTFSSWGILHLITPSFGTSSSECLKVRNIISLTHYEI